MTRAELGEAAAEEWLRERLGHDVRQPVLRLDLVEMDVALLYRLVRGASGGRCDGPGCGNRSRSWSIRCTRREGGRR